MSNILEYQTLKNSYKSYQNLEQHKSSKVVMAFKLAIQNEVYSLINTFNAVCFNYKENFFGFC